jgi:hypothetical protein
LTVKIPDTLRISKYIIIFTGKIEIMTGTPDTSQICCPRFDPEPWDDKIVTWENKKFIKDHVRTIFYMPLNFGKAMKRLNEKVESAGAAMPDWLCLSDHTSAWNMDLYLAVDKEVPGTENVSLTGRYYCKVYEGPFKNTGRWSEHFKSLVKAKGLTQKKFYLWYTTCPKCARKYGKNYVVLVAGVE